MLQHLSNSPSFLQDYFYYDCVKDYYNYTSTIVRISLHYLLYRTVVLGEAESHCLPQIAKYIGLKTLKFNNPCQNQLLWDFQLLITWLKFLGEEVTGDALDSPRTFASPTIFSNLRPCYTVEQQDTNNPCLYTKSNVFIS